MVEEFILKIFKTYFVCTGVKGVCGDKMGEWDEVIGVQNGINLGHPASIVA
jgi:hypothetical protein